MKTVSFVVGLLAEGRMTPDEQEALSRKYSDDIIILLQLKSGNWACFNNARELCGIEENGADAVCSWFKPKPTPTFGRKRPTASLEELGLL